MGGKAHRSGDGRRTGHRRIGGQRWEEWRESDRKSRHRWKRRKKETQQWRGSRNKQKRKQERAKNWCINPYEFSRVPSPSSLIDLGSDTAKHCMVSYFCWAASCWSAPAQASPSARGFTSMRQLKVWLFLCDESLLRWLTEGQEVQQESTTESFKSPTPMKMAFNMFLHFSDGGQI